MSPRPGVVVCGVTDAEDVRPVRVSDDGTVLLGGGSGSTVPDDYAVQPHIGYGQTVGGEWVPLRVDADGYLIIS